MHGATIRESTVKTEIGQDWTPLTDEQFEDYEQNGYIHLKGLFTPEEVQRGLTVIDEVIAQDERTIENHAGFADRTHTVPSLWHVVVPNKIQERKTLILRYGHLWHRPHDYVQQPAEVLERMSPRLRRMSGDFGDNVHPTDYCKSVDQGDVMAVGGSYGGK
ncbi:hypothetical protein ABZV29_34670 [Streptomyces sp. NPDC005236]|uniref:hypothetical protein n=1 Tax=Streptomyces sp. NPDC005236 TaxID=3157028 RepID=UPI0033B2FF0E